MAHRPYPGPNPERKKAWDRLAPRHPLIAYYRRTGDGSARTVADPMTPQQYHRLAIYQEVYRHVGVEHHRRASIAPSRDRQVAIGFLRGKGASLNGTA